MLATLPKPGFGLAVAVLLAAGLRGGADDVTPKPLPGDLPDPVRQAVHSAIQKVYPALVRIHVVTVYYVDGREIKGEAFGSGVIISPDGYVITNHHVVGKARRMKCTLSTRDEVEATLIGSDALADIAIIKLESNALGKNKPLPVAQFGDSDKLKVGDRVLAMGSPRALSQSVTMGIVSNREMTLPRSTFGSFRLDGEEVGSLVRWIGHDAQIFPGNSGGPLVSLDGQIIGINDISAGLGGAIPGNLAREVAEQLIQYGELKRSWLGLAVQPLLKSTKVERGVLVSSVLPGSPADKAGLKPGDILFSFNGKTFTIRHGEQVPEFNRLVLSTPIGATVALVYFRDGKETSATITTQSRGTAEGKEAEFKSWGLTLQELSLLAAKEMQREPYSGLLVTSVRPGASAAEARPPLQPNDILLDVAGKPVRSLQDLENLTSALASAKEKQAPVLVDFERRKQRLLTVVKLGERETPDRSADARKAWLPVETQVLTKELAEALGLKGKKGVRITQVFPGNTAEKAGLKVGDILLKLDDEIIDVSKPEEAEVFTTMVRRHRVGTKVKLDVVRDRKRQQLEVELAASPRSARELVDYHNTRFEFRARDLMFQDRLAQELPSDQRGALITLVESGGWAALARLSAYDVLIAVDGEPIRSVAELRAQMKKIEETKPSRVVFFVRRGVHTVFLELEPAWGPR